MFGLLFPQVYAMVELAYLSDSSLYVKSTVISQNSVFLFPLPFTSINPFYIRLLEVCGPCTTTQYSQKNVYRIPSLARQIFTSTWKTDPGCIFFTRLRRKLSLNIDLGYKFKSLESQKVKFLAKQTEVFAI